MKTYKIIPAAAAAFLAANLAQANENTDAVPAENSSAELVSESKGSNGVYLEALYGVAHKHLASGDPKVDIFGLKLGCEFVTLVEAQDFTLNAFVEGFIGYGSEEESYSHGDYTLSEKVEIAHLAGAIGVKSRYFISDLLAVSAKAKIGVDYEEIKYEVKYNYEKGDLDANKTGLYTGSASELISFFQKMSLLSPTSNSSE